MISRFPTYLSDPALEPAPLSVLTPLLGHSRPAVRKRAITTLAQFLPLTQPEYASRLVQTTILPALSASTPAEQKRTVVQLIAAVARHSPHHIAPYMKDVVTGIINAVSKDDEELKDSSLQVCDCRSRNITHLTGLIRLLKHLYSDVLLKSLVTWIL